MKKLNIAILTVLLVFQTILSPLGMFGVSFASAASGEKSSTENANPASLTNNKLELAFEKLVYDGKDIVDQASAEGISPRADEKVSIYYTFEKPNGVDMLQGDTFSFKLPQQLLLYDEAALSGKIEVGGIDYFTYKTNAITKEVTITATQYIPEGMTGGIDFSAVFGNFGSNTSLNQELEILIPNQQSIVLEFTFEPKVQGQNISKEGKVTTNANGDKFIDWEVWFNLSGSTLNEVTFKDDIDEGHAYVPNSLKVETAEVEATLEGVGLKQGTTATNVTPPSPTTNANLVQFKLTPGKKAVKVTYQTEITREASEEKEYFQNSVEITGANLPTDKAWKVAKDVEVTYGKPLSKEKVGGNKYEADWLIEFNKIGKTLPANTTLTDTISGGHTFDQNSIEVTKYEQVAGIWQSKGLLVKEDYTVTFDETNTQFVVTLLKAGKYAVDVAYTTKTTDEFVFNAGVINNKLETSLQKTETERYSISTNFSYPDGVGYKSISDIDYANRELEWTVTFDTEGKEVKEFTIADAFTEGLTLIPYSDGSFFKVRRGPEADITFANVTAGAKGFDVTLNEGKTFNGLFIFTYKTKYDLLKTLDSNFTGYTNNVNFTWDGVNQTDYTLPKSATFTPIDSHKNNAEKFGSYHYADRKFTWTAHINQDRLPLEQGTQVIDSLGTGHKLVAGSVKVYNATVNKDGSLTKGSESTDFTVSGEVNGFKAVLKADFSKPYIIEYQSEDSDNIIGQATGIAGEYKNELVMKSPDGTKELGKASKSVTIDRANQLIGKSPKQNPSDSTVSWTVDVNISGSKLTGVVLNDTLTANHNATQKLLSDTFKIQAINFTPTGIEYGESKNIVDAKNAGWVQGYTVNDMDFTINFGDLTDAATPQAFRVTYDSYYDGPDKTAGAFGNKAVVTVTEAMTGVKNTSEITHEQGQYIHNDSNAYANFKRVDFVLTKLGINQDLKQKQGISYAGNPLANVKFELFNQSGSYKLGEKTTGPDGTLKFENIGYGKYKLKETHSLDGYDGNNKEYDVVINAEGVKIDGKVAQGNTLSPDKMTNTNATATIENSEYVNSVELTKTFSRGTGDFSKVKFELYRADNTRVTTTQKAEFLNGVRTLTTDKSDANLTFTPDSNGKIYIPYLASGNYYFKEVATAIGYKLDATNKPFRISANATTKANAGSLTNNPRQLIITNTGDDDEPLSGSTFEIYKLENGTSCPNPTDGKVSDVTTNSNYKKVENITIITGADGKKTVDISTLPEGQYFIVQKNITNVYYVNRPTEVVKIDTSNCFTVSPTEEKDVTPPVFENPRDTSSSLAALTLTKTLVDGNKSAIEGAVIELTGKKKNSPQTYYGKTDGTGTISEWYTDEAMLSKATTIVQDKYTVTELYETGFAYEGLAKLGTDGFTNDSGIVFDYNKLNPVTEIQVTNKKITRSIEIQNSCGIEETQYQITDLQGNPIALVDVNGNSITGNNIVNASTGTVKILAGENLTKIADVHLPSGDYKVKQLTTSPGCNPVDKTPTITVTPDKPDDTKPADETDEPIKTPVKNEDPSDKTPITDSTFKVYKLDDNASCPSPNAAVTSGYTDVTSSVPSSVQENGNYVLKTNDKGQFEIDWSKLGSGKFVVVQDEVNKFYVNKENVPVQIDTSTCYTNSNTPPTTTPTFENERGKGKVVIMKKDATDSQLIDGAEITITTQNATKGTSKTYTATTVKGVAEFTDVLYDTYKITETKFPAGYEGLVTGLTNDTFNLNTDTNFVDGEFAINITNKKIERTVTITDACTLGERVYGIYSSDGNTELKRVTLAEGESSNDITMNFTLPDGQSTANFVVKQISSENPDCKQTGEPAFPVTRDESPTPNKTVPFTGNVVTLTFESCEGPLQSGTFTLVNKNDTTKSYTVTVGTDGEVKTNIPAGTYTIKELNDKEVTIPTSADGTATVTIETVDCYKPIILLKSCDQTSSQFDGQPYVIYKESDTSVQYRTGTITNGQVSLTDKGVPNGKYIVEVGGKQFPIEVNGNTAINISTTENCYKVVIPFISCDGPLSDNTTVPFKIYKDNVVVTEILTTDAQSKVTVVDLSPGNYTIVKNGEDPNAGTPFEIVSTDVTIPTSIQIADCFTPPVSFAKCDAATSVPTGSYNVYKKDDTDKTTPYRTVTVDNTGKGTFDKALPAGDYVVVIGTDTFDLTVTSNAEVIVQTTDNCYTAEVSFKTCDQAGTTTVFELFEKDSSGNYVKVPGSTTYTGSSATIEELKPNGQYALIPQTAGGDHTAPFTKEFTVDPTASNKSITVDVQTSNNCYTAEVNFKNCNSNATAVAYTITKDNDSSFTPVKVTSLTNGKVELKNLTPGTYKVTKDSANTSTSFTITPGQTGNTTLTITDVPCPPSPTPPPAPTCDKDVTITVTPGKTITVDGKTYTDGDNDGKVIVPVKDLPKNSTLTVTEDGKTTGTVTTKADCEASFTPAAPSCSEAEVTLKDYANQTVTITKDGGSATTAKVDASGKLVIPHKDGKIVVSDAQGNEIGSVTLVDCKGTFEFVNKCTVATLTVVELANKTVTAEHNGKTVNVSFDKDGKATLPFTDGKVTLKDGEKALGSVDLKDCKGTFVLEKEKEVCTYPESVTVPTEHTGKTATVTNGSTTTTVVVPETGVIPLTFEEGTTTVTIDGTVVATVTETCEVIVEKEELPVNPETPEPKPEEPVEPIEPEPNPEIPAEPKPEPTEPETPGTEKPTPGPEKPVTPPVTPGKPTPSPTPGGNTDGNTGTPSGNGTNPGPSVTPGSGTNVNPPVGSVKLPPKVENIVKKWDSTISNYPQARVPQMAMQDLLTLVEEYENMTESERRALEKQVNMKKVYDILIAQGLLTNADRPTFLPQTNGTMNEAWTYMGLMLVLVSAFFLVRRRQA